MPWRLDLRSSVGDSLGSPGGWVLLELSPECNAANSVAEAVSCFLLIPYLLPVDVLVVSAICVAYDQPCSTVFLGTFSVS